MGRIVQSQKRQLSVADYVALRAYAGAETVIFVTGYLATKAPVGITGHFALDASDTTSADNGGTIIVGAGGRRWKRTYTGPKRVDWFGGDPTGIATSHDAINAAYASVSTFGEIVEYSAGNYKLGASTITSGKGTIIRGASQYGTYFTAVAGATFPMLKIKHQMTEVSGIIFRPVTSTQTPILAYAGRANIHDCYFLSGSRYAGAAIVMTDTDPDTSAAVSGAYAHIIQGCTFGDGGYEFANGITETSASGITACKFLNNRFLSDRPIKLNKGGGNTYIGNLLQSATGTDTVKAGVGLTFGPNVTGEKVMGNYMEDYLSMIETQNTSTTYQLFYAVGNHNDGCNAAVSDAGSKKYIIEDQTGVQNSYGWSISYAATTLWKLTSPAGKVGHAMDGNGNCFWGATSGANHIINRAGAGEGDVILSVQGSGSTGLYMQHVTAGVNNAGAAGLSVMKHSTTLRSINMTGTMNTQGSDYAEYMSKADGCGTVAKGQIVGVNAMGQVTDRWADAIAYLVKSTDPSMVGGDTWANDLGVRPVEPVYVEPGYTGVDAGLAPVGRTAGVDIEQSEGADDVYAELLAKWEALKAQEDSDRAAHADQVAKAEAAHAKAMGEWAQAAWAYDMAYEKARQGVDRIAFCGRVPVNVKGARPGQFIVAEPDGEGITGHVVDEESMTMRDYLRAVGRVITVQGDGRAFVIVKPV